MSRDGWCKETGTEGLTKEWRDGARKLGPVQDLGSVHNPAIARLRYNIDKKVEVDYSHMLPRGSR